MTTTQRVEFQNDYGMTVAFVQRVSNKFIVFLRDVDNVSRGAHRFDDEETALACAEQCAESNTTYEDVVNALRVIRS